MPAESRSERPGRRLVARLAAISACAFVVVACGGQHGRRSAGLEVFNACIGRSQFLTLARDRAGGQVVEVIDDRARGAMVGQVTSGRGAGILGGAAARAGRFTMSTATPLGRDASAIERCWDQHSPIAPNS